MKKISNILLIIMLSAILISEVGDMIVSFKKVEKYIIENQEGATEENNFDNE